MTAVLKSAAVLLGLLAVVPTAVGLFRPDDAKPAAPPDPVLARTEAAEDVEVLRRVLNRAVGLPRPWNGFGGIGGLQGGSGGLHGSGGIGGGGLGGFGGGIGGLGGNFGGGISGVNGFGGGLQGGGLGGFGGVPIPAVDTFDGTHLKGTGAVFSLRVPPGQTLAARPPAVVAGAAVTCTKCHAADSAVLAKVKFADSFYQTKFADTLWQAALLELLTAAAPAPAADQGLPARTCEYGRLTETVVQTLGGAGRKVRHLAAGEGLTVAVTFPKAADGWPAPAPPPPPAAFTPEEEKQLLLGDLHTRQSNPKEAAESYRKALARFADKPNKAVADARKKLAQALIAADDLDGAKAVLDLLGKAASPAKPSARPLLPGKLVIRVGKADLDAAEAIDPAEFRRRVTVETTSLPPADKPKRPEGAKK